MMGRGPQQRKLLAAVIGERHRNAVFQRGNREIGGLVQDDCTVALERERVGVELLEYETLQRRRKVNPRHCVYP